MSAVIEEVVAQEGGVGRVARVTGPVVDVEFPVEAMPELNNALRSPLILAVAPKRSRVPKSTS